MNEDQILQVRQQPLYQTLITFYEWVVYSAFNLKATNPSDEMTISIQNQDIFTHITNSFLLIEGRITKGAVAGVEKNYSLVKNAFPYLFEEVRYEINGHVIDKVRNVGITNNMKVYTMNNKAEEEMMWNNHVNADGSFVTMIPLSALLGFAQYHDKVIMKASQSLVLLRAKDDKNLFVSEAQPTVELIKVQWHVPHVKVNDKAKIDLLMIEKKELDLAASFRSYDLYEYPLTPNSSKQSWRIRTMLQMEKPRYVILGFQIDRKKIESDASKFDHCNLSSVKLYLNSDSYPHTPLNIDFEQNSFELLYRAYVNLRPHLTGKSIDPLFNREEFKESAPLVVIDCSRQNESIKSSVVDIRLEFEAKKPFPQNTIAYCIIVHDRIIEYNPVRNETKIIT